MSVQARESTDLADRLAPKLAELYGPRALEALTAISQVCESHLAARGAPTPRNWNERDAIVVAYPDHVQSPSSSPLAALGDLLVRHRLDDVFSLLHVLPLHPSTSDEGFAVSDERDVDAAHGSWDDIHALAQRFDLVIDIVLNHVSRGHRWFMGYLAGEEPFVRYFIEADPRADLDAVARPRESPLLTTVDTSRGRRHVWTTFGPDQVDLDYREPRVLAEVVGMVLAACRHGARILRLDAVGYLWKEQGTACLNHPNVHRVVEVLRDVVDVVAPGTWLLTESNVPQSEGLRYWGTGQEAQLVYNFSLPPLLLDALVNADASPLKTWLGAYPDPPVGTTLVNFTASHDGVGLRPVEGLLSAQRLARLAEVCTGCGGLVSTRSTAMGSVPYELNATFASALADPVDPAVADAATRRFVLSQALMLAVRGIPAVYLSSLVAAPNDRELTEATGRARSINRHRYRADDFDALAWTQPVFETYRALLQARTAHPAFHPDAEQTVVTELRDPALVGFVRIDRDRHEPVLVLANVGTTRQAVDLAALGYEPNGHALVTGAATLVGSIVTLEPHGFTWQRVSPRSTPQEDMWPTSSRTG